MLTQKDREDLMKNFNKGNKMMSRHPSYLDLGLKVSKKDFINHLIDNDPNFQTIQVDDMKFNLFDESGTGEPTIFQLIRWNNLINRLNDTYFGKDDIIDERWDSEWYDYVGDNFSNYDSESFCFMREDWKYELEESQERRMISEWINL